MGKLAFTEFEGRTYKHIEIRNIQNDKNNLIPGKRVTLYGYPHVQAIEYIGYDDEQMNILARLISGDVQLRQYEYLIFSRRFLEEYMK